MDLAVASPHATTASPLVEYALAGLRRCWLDERQTWSHKYHLDGRDPPNECVPASDLYYSLNVLLGLSRVREMLTKENYPSPGILLENLDSALRQQKVRNGAWGMACWAAAELALDPPASALARMRQLANDPATMKLWTAQDIGLTLSGAVACASHDQWLRHFCDKLALIILEQLRGSKALFRDSAFGPRRHFATFATQVYAALSLYQYGELSGDDRAIDAANACVTTLIGLQGKNGEWPWFYHPATARVVDPYEVYSVHQHGMGPALLHHAVVHGVPGAREAIRDGFEWLFGKNEMRVSMLVPSLSLIYRSQARRGFRGSRLGRVLLSGATLIQGNGGWSSNASKLRLTEEMRSYEFGWLLWSFGDRTDYPELTHRHEFCRQDLVSS